MALVKDGLWGIVSETESDPGNEEAEAHIKFLSRRDRALAIIVLSVEPSLLYLIGDPEDPVAVWKKLRDQFQKKTWANKLELRRKLYSLQLNDGESVQEHIKAITELFDALAMKDSPVSDEDKVVHLLASLPDSFNMLVTALEANSETVPNMENVTERLMHEEKKLKERAVEDDERRAFAVKGRVSYATTARSQATSSEIAESWLLSMISHSNRQKKLLQPLTYHGLMSLAPPQKRFAKTGAT